MIWPKLLSLVLSVGRWFQLRAEAERNVQAGKDQKDAETLAKVSQGAEARRRVGSDPTHARLLAEELGLEASDDGQLLSQLRTAVSFGVGSFEYKKRRVAKLRNVQGALYRYSSTSLRHLSSCETGLQLIGLEMSLIRDCTVICGNRTNREQEKAFASGRSKLKAGQSRHNIFPSQAMDIVPAEAVKAWALGEDLPSEMYWEFHRQMNALAVGYGLNLRWGGDWDGDGSGSDQTFNDYAHYERV